jgi:hypothetical protein
MSQSILDLPIISRTRRNHGLEHATLHLLSEKYPHVTMGGMSTPGGFTIIGNVTTEDVAEAAIEALKKLRSGEAQLAMHPNCGTNFAISGIFAGLAAWLGTLGSGKSFRRKLERLPLIITLATLALVLTKPLGPLVQKRITTSGNPQALDLVRVETSLRAGMRWHRVTTRG